MRRLIDRVTRYLAEDVLVLVPKRFFKEQEDLSHGRDTQPLHCLRLKLTQRRAKLHAPTLQNAKRQRDNDAIRAIVAGLGTNQYLPHGIGIEFNTADDFLEADVETFF